MNQALEDRFQFERFALKMEQTQARLDDARAAEQANLSTPTIWREKIDDLDAGLEHFDFGALFGEFGRRLVNRTELLCVNRAALIDRRTNDIQDATENFRADGNLNRRACVFHSLPALQTVSGIHRDAADGVFAQVLRYLDRQVVVFVVNGRIADQKSGVDLREATAKFHVHDGPDDLGDASSAVCLGCIHRKLSL